MYPQRELTRLAAYKAELRQSIAEHRILLAHTAAQVAGPLDWLDRAWGLYKRLLPLAKLAALPMGCFLTRVLSPRLKLIGTLVSLGPLLVGALRGASSLASKHFEASGSKEHQS